MSTREKNLIKLSSHPILGKLFSKLSKDEKDQVTAFVKDNAHLDDNEFITKANRWFVDPPRPKHHVDMWAIVTQLK